MQKAEITFETISKEIDRLNGFIKFLDEKNKRFEIQTHQMNREEAIERGELDSQISGLTPQY